jgi:hypothetical protein
MPDTKEVRMAKQRAACKDCYSRNKEKRLREIYAKKREMVAWLREYRSKLGCQECQENHPACLQFHHVDPNTKEINLSFAANRGWSKKRILKEIEKCIVLCANCHFKLHASDG